MLKEFELKVIEKLNKIATTKKYFGELAKPSESKLNLASLPMVYLDFTGSSKLSNNRLKYEHNFCLYIVHLSYSKNENTRTQKHYELYDLLDELKKALNLQTFSSFEPVTWGTNAKIYDQVVAGGYLTVFIQEFKTVF